MTAADGDPVKAGSWRLRSTDHEALAWLEQAAVIAGYVVVGSGRGSQPRDELRRAELPIRWLYLATREVSWRVMNVEPHEADDADTFCAVVPGKHAFTLAGGVYTKNCGACEPECLVEAIFPEDALPDKWEPFVEINYAYGDGADVVNNLNERVRHRAQRAEPAAREQRLHRGGRASEKEVCTPQDAWSNKRERQYEHIKDSAKERGASTKRAKEIAARTVNKERARSGEARTSSRTSRQDMSSSRCAASAPARTGRRAARRSSSTTRPSGWASTAAPR